MISIIITTLKEFKTLPQAIKAILDQSIKQDYEILVIGPDQETEKIVKEFAQINSKIEYLQDQGKGKPAALNLGFKKARGEILILTDGDVWIKKNILEDFLKYFEDKNIGAVTGQPISLNSKNNMLGYWSHFLTQAAHQWRLKNNSFSCSGYLYGFRNIIKEIPNNTLAEDGIISGLIRKNGYQIAYAAQAEVYVKYPDNFQDWLKQKLRSTGGYIQKQSRKERNFFQEVQGGITMFFTYPKNIKEFYWTILLYLSRIYLWLKILWQIKIKNKSFESIWQRVESTK